LISRKYLGWTYYTIRGRSCNTGAGINGRKFAKFEKAIERSVRRRYNDQEGSIYFDIAFDMGN